MMRRMQDGNGDENGPEPMSEDVSGPGKAGGPPSASPHVKDPPTGAAPPQALANPIAGGLGPRQPLSVDIPTRDSLPEHRIQVSLCYLSVCQAITGRTGSFL